MDSIFFSRGIPSPDVLPVEALAECANAVLARDGRTVLNYGPAGGYPPLREWIAAQHGVDPTQIVLSTGSLAGFNFLVRHLFADGGRAVIEAPSYDRTIGVLRAARAEIEPVPLSEDGLDLDRLESILAEGPAPRLIYTIPTFQNPSGRTLSLEQRHALVELAQAKGLLIYEDDPYRLVRYSGEALPSMYELAGGKGVVFSTSFSKTGAPGLRIGYMILPAELVKPIEAIAASMYIGPPPLPQAMLHEYIQRGLFEPNLAVVCDLLRQRRDAMLESLEAEFPEGAVWSHPDGGYFLWLDLPPGVKIDPLFERAAEAGVQLVKGTDFYPDGSGDESARLAFSFPSVEEIREGIRRLGALVRELAGVPA
jgi:DNA-binding transcriptional MocR family regulator